MKIWGLLRRNQKIIHDTVEEFSIVERPRTADEWAPVLDVLCRALDLSRPVVLEKHVGELARFSRTAFRADDFLESVDFDRFELEIFPEEKKSAPNV